MTWDILERVAKIVSLVAIPIVLAVIGWLIQNSLAKRNVSQEYVKIAISILKESKDKGDPALRDWAVDLLNENSPTKFSSTVVKKLKAGEASLPAQLAALFSTGGVGASMALGPDGKIVATGHTDGSSLLWNLDTGEAVASLRGHEAPVTALAFSPNARLILSGSLDGTAKIWDVSTAREISRLLGHTDGIIGACFTPDGSTVLTRSLDGTIRKWNPKDGRMLTIIQVPEKSTTSISGTNK